MKKTVFFLALLLLTQCKIGSNKQEAGDIAEIDVSQKYPEREVFLQDIAKVEYIPLETNDNTLVSISQTVYVSDNYIIVINIREGDILVFDGKGKSKFSFNNKGQSGTEYINLSRIAFDEKAKEIFVSNSFAAEPKFLVYSEDGKFKRSLPYPPNFTPTDIYSFNENTLLVYDTYGLNQDNYSAKPYLLIDKNDGNIVDTLDIHLPVRVSNRVPIQVEVDGQMLTTALTLSISNSRSYGNNFLISDWSSDTIFRLTPQKELQPVLVRKPSVHNSDPKMIISNELITDKYFFFTKAVFDFESAQKSRTFPMMSLMYDFKTMQLNEYKLINKDYDARNVGFESTITPENTGVYKLDVFRLFDADEAGQLKGELKELLKMLDGDDNPVLVKVSFF
jgi:hypothetical protein